MGYFDEDDVKQAEDDVRRWQEANPEAATALANIWRNNVMTAGHKTTARVVASYGATPARGRRGE